MFRTGAVVQQLHAAGVTVLAALVRASLVRVHMRAWLVWGAVALLVYEELTPFSVIASAADLPERFARVEWVPFLSHFGADLPSALFDLGKKAVLGAALGAAMRYATPRPRLVLVLGGPELEPQTVELLRQMIRNQCVNDGSVASGQEVRTTDVLRAYLEGDAWFAQDHWETAAHRPGQQRRAAP